MSIQLSDHFTFGRLLRFTGPTVAMMIFTAIYGIVDGLFVSNCAGATPFAALNLIFPLSVMLGAIGYMLGTGGAALVAKTLGEGQAARANGLFTFLVLATAVAGVTCGAVGLAIVEPVARLLGATGELLDYSVLYGRILCVGVPFVILQYAFQSFLATAGKPKVGFAVVCAAGVTNIVLDWLLVARLGLGLAGAGAATVTGQAIAGLVPVGYFARRNTSLLGFTRPLVEWRALGRACLNGASELVVNLAQSLVVMLYNYQLMRFYGQVGVSAYGVVDYVSWTFTAIFLGYATGAAPLVGYNFGAQNRAELKNLLAKSLIIVGTAGVVLTVAAQLLARPVATLFVGYDPEVWDLTVRALSIYTYAFLIMGFNIYASSFFTALNNGAVSAAISFMRTLVFQIGAVLVLPAVFGADAIWGAVIVGEACSLVVSASFFVGMRKRYGYA